MDLKKAKVLFLSPGICSVTIVSEKVNNKRFDICLIYLGRWLLDNNSF